MSTLSRSRSAPSRPTPLAEAHLQIPDALITWACDNDRQLAWAHPYGNDLAALVAAAITEPLTPSTTERLLSRLDAIASAAIAEGRGDLLTGLDLQTAEWLGLHLRLDTPRGPLHVGPDPRSRPTEGATEPPWTFAEVRIVFDAQDPAAVNLAWAAKQVLETFPEGWAVLGTRQARITSLEHGKFPTPCPACNQPPGPLMMVTDAGTEFHYRCWAEMVAPMPEHLAKLLRKAPKAQQR